MQAADLPPHIKLHSMHAATFINLAAKMMNLHQQSDIERFICTLFTDWTHKSGLFQYSPQPLNINYPVSSGRVNVARGWGGGVQQPEQPT